MSDDKNARLREAVARNDLQGVRAALDDGADLRTVDANSYTPLHRAVWTVRIHGTEMLELLLSRGADPNQAEVGHLNAFELAVAIPDIVLARRLLEAGARVSRTALERARLNPEMLALLEEWPIRSSTASERDKQLLLAARAGNLEEVTALLRDGADPAARDAAGLSAFDHAWTRQHPNVACALERAEAERDPNAALFIAALDNRIGGILDAADKISLEVRTHRGLTALMLTARYGRQFALQTLLSRGAQVDQRNGASTALVYAIEAGELAIMQLLLDKGATINLDVDGDNPVLSAACRQSDSELLKQLLLRGLDVAPYPKQWAADSEAARLLGKARAGVLPIAGPPSYCPPSECAVCRDLPELMRWRQGATGEFTGESLPAITEQFEMFGWSRRGYWKCPWCGTFYDYEFDHDNGYTDGWDSEDLKRVSLEHARVGLGSMPSTPRIEREIESLTEAIKFNDAVAVPGGKVQVPGTEVKHGTQVLMIYSLAADGAKQIAWRRVRASELAALVERLKTRGFPVAETDFFCDFVWTVNAGTVEVYDSKSKVFDAAGDRAILSSGRVVSRTDFAQVIAFADEYVYRGVKARLRSGEEVSLVTEYSLSASGDPCYSRNELLFETGWCSTLGHAIATWAGTSFEDLI